MLTQIEKLDTVLFQMCIHTYSYGLVTATDILDSLPEINLFELDKILDKMAKDGYHNSEVLCKDIIQYKINYDGIAFWSNGGYARKLNDENEKLSFKKKEVKRNSYYTKINTWLSISALIISLVALTLDFVKP